MLYILLASIFLIFSFIVLIGWLNNSISKKIHKKNLENLETIERFQYNSKIFFAIKIINKKGVYFKEINSWIIRYFNLMGVNFQRVVNQYNYINTQKKYFFIIIFLLWKTQKQISKLKKEIVKLNNEIQNKIKIKELEDDYKVNLSEKYKKLKNILNKFLIMNPEFEQNEKLRSLNDEITTNIKVVDEKIDDGEFCASVKILFNISELIETLFNVLNLYPQILRNLNTEIPLQIQDIGDLSIFNRYENNSDNFKNKFNSFKNEVTSKSEEINDLLQDFNYDLAIVKLNNLMDNINEVTSNFKLINEINSKFISPNSIVFQNINELFTTLKNLKINFPLYLGEFNYLKPEEQLVFKKAEKIANKWNYEISKTYEYNAKLITLKEFILGLNKTKELVILSKESADIIKELIDIFNFHKKDINNLSSKVFNLKNTLNNLLQWLKKYNSEDLKYIFLKKIQQKFKELDNFNLKKLYPSNKNKINSISIKLNHLEEETKILENDIRKIILFDKLTEELIIYNNKYLIHRPDIIEVLKESRKAYNENDIDLSFRLSLSIIDTINNN